MTIDHTFIRWPLGLARYFINAPSTLQPDHQYHGRKVLAPDDLNVESGPCIDVVFLDDGAVTSCRVNKTALSRL